MLITEKVMEHYFPQQINSFKSEYYRLFGFEMQSNIDSPVKGWRHKYIGKELSKERVRAINDYFQKYIVPKIKKDENVLFNEDEPIAMKEPNFHTMQEVRF